MESRSVSTENMLEQMKWPRKFSEAEGRVLYALKNYQIIEMVLKSFLLRQNIVGANGTDDIKELPLGLLVRRFKKINSNTILHNLLSNVVEDRNKMAHQALVLHDKIFADSMGFEAVSMRSIKSMDSRALKAMTEIICEFIRTQPENASS